MKIAIKKMPLWSLIWCDIARERKKCFLRREVSNVGTMDWVLPHPQLETQITRVKSQLYLCSCYTALQLTRKCHHGIVSESASLKCDYLEMFSPILGEDYRKPRIFPVVFQSDKLLTGILLRFGSSLTTSRSWIFSLYTSK